MYKSMKIIFMKCNVKSTFLLVMREDKKQNNKIYLEIVLIDTSFGR